MVAGYRARSRTGRLSVPLTAIELTRRTGPSNSIAYAPSSSSEKSTRICARASVAPMRVLTDGEGDVPIRRTRDVELVRVGEHVLVTVGGGKPEHDLVAGGDALPAQFVRARGGPHAVGGARCPPHDLLDRAGQQRTVLSEALPLLRVFE